MDDPERIGIPVFVRHIPRTDPESFCGLHIGVPVDAGPAHAVLLIPDKPPNLDLVADLRIPAMKGTGREPFLHELRLCVFCPPKEQEQQNGSQPFRQQMMMFDSFHRVKS